MQALLDEGKVKAIGVSEGTVDQIRTIHSIVPVSVLEEEWSLFSREVEVKPSPLLQQRCYHSTDPESDCSVS